MDELGFRNMWISLGIGMTVAAVGMVLLRHHDEARAVFGMVCLVLTIVLRHVLDDRKLRAIEDQRAREQAHAESRESLSRAA
jgi:hypothetical protein